MNHHQRTWSLQDAKARLSQVIRLAQSEGPQTVTVHGEPAVTISKVEAEQKPKPKLSGLTGADMLKAWRKGPLFDFELPERPKDGKFRDVDL
jgi:prevent-host-death family protein